MFVDNINLLQHAMDECLMKPYQSTDIKVLFDNIKDQIISFCKNGGIE
jgi:hypothetical protein